MTHFTDCSASTVSESGSSDSDSDSLCALSELKAAQEKAQVWKARAMEYREERDYLRERVISLEKCLESKIFQLEGTLPQQLFQGCSSSKAPAPSVTVGRLEAAAKMPKEVESSDRETSLGDELACGSPGSTAPRASQQPMLPPPPSQISNATTVANFSYLDNGTFHLAKGVVVRPEAAFKIMRNLKPTLVVKDTAEAVWGKDVLEKKSVTGMVAPRKKSLGEVAKEPLTPEKVAVVAATLKHWGAEKNIDVEATLLNLGHLLSEKIQDVLKSKRRLKFQ
ncbi:uncharacterized protein LOC142587469 isoform X1 [Dermacentor variabilis]|uniref:uncharacterized protein LOC142587469 isoform X1 n=1 Tax=Dermacentor variabilis TaxID=34621 RepID=UPI003F5C42DF